MSDEGRSAEEIRRDLAEAARLIADGDDARDVLHMLAMDVEPLLDRSERAERECAELREERDRLRELNGRQAQYIEELQKPVQEDAIERAAEVLWNSGWDNFEPDAGHEWSNASSDPNNLDSSEITHTRNTARLMLAAAYPSLVTRPPATERDEKGASK